ncbi:enoyl-CoA hydratase-related protein, partial [Chitinophagales bacterium]|nr:enoyl-CoA hydratase-related protein [Chitinophagales bacterium]
MSSYKNLLVEIGEDGILLITINRPDKLNALNSHVLREIGEALSEIENSTEVIGIIITGSGNKAFAAGADIAEFANYTKEQASELSANGHNLFDRMESFPKPIIAAVNGFSLGGGCELAMACHMRFAAEHAKFGQPEVNLGVIPGYGATQRLPQLIGKGRAFELLMT